MKRTEIPSRVGVPFADKGTKNTIPVDSQIGVVDGAASFTDGFPPLTMTPVVAGGIPPAGGDFNGILNAITQSVRWACAGGQYQFDSAFSTVIGGYPKGALIQNADGSVLWLNTIDDNTSNPDTGTGWIPAMRYGITAVSLAAANITLTPAQAAKETIVLSGALTANVQVIMPAWIESWLIVNNCTGSFTVSVKTTAGSGINLGTGTSSQVYGDGTNIYYGALMVRNNLAEIKAAGSNSQSAARANLALGSAAIHDVTTSPTDTTAGRVLTVGAGGLLGMALPVTDANLTNKDGLVSMMFTNSIHFGGYGSGVHLFYGDSGDGTQALSANIFVDSAGNLWAEWLAIKKTDGSIVAQRKQKLWGPFNKPTPGDIGALPITGGTLTGNLEIADTAPIIQLTESDSGKKYFLIADGNGFRINEDSPTGNAVLSYAGASKRLVTVGQFAPGDWANFDARYMGKSNAYTKTESDARYVTGVQFGAVIQVNAESYTAPAGHVLAGVVAHNGNYDTQIDAFKAKPIQRQINNQWVTIPG